MDNRRITNHEPVPIAVKIHWIYGESGNNFRRTILVLLLSIPFERFHLRPPCPRNFSIRRISVLLAAGRKNPSFGKDEIVRTNRALPIRHVDFCRKEDRRTKKKKEKKKTSHKRQLQLPSPRESRRFFSLSPSSKRTSIPRTEISVLDWRVVEAIRKYHLPPSPSLEILLKFPLIILALAGEIDFNRLCTRPT